MKISIIIPVYNEADHLRACLKSIASLNTQPHEVIVVDNNSTDGTVLVAESFPFVKLIREPKQGVVHARSRGFDKATGDVIARIDGDSVLPAEWVDRLLEVFSDSSIDATSGVALYSSVALADVINSIDLFFRRRLEVQLQDRLFLWGANMAIRKQAWLKVKSSLCNIGDIHEDYDIAIHLQAMGGKVTFDERLVAQVSSRRIESDFLSFMHYVWVSPATYAYHDIKVKRYLYPIVAVCAAGYWPAYVLHKGYDEDLERFSFSKLFAPKTTVTRVDPTSNVAYEEVV